jgi:hypothetical protein
LAAKLLLPAGGRAPWWAWAAMTLYARLLASFLFSMF